MKKNIPNEIFFVDVSVPKSTFIASSSHVHIRTLISEVNCYADIHSCTHLPTV